MRLLIKDSGGLKFEGFKANILKGIGAIPRTIGSDLLWLLGQRNGVTENILL